LACALFARTFSASRSDRKNQHLPGGVTFSEQKKVQRNWLLGLVAFPWFLSYRPNFPVVCLEHMRTQLLALLFAPGGETDIKNRTGLSNRRTWLNQESNFVGVRNKRGMAGRTRTAIPVIFCLKFFGEMVSFFLLFFLLCFVGFRHGFLLGCIRFRAHAVPAHWRLV